MIDDVCVASIDKTELREKKLLLLERVADLMFDMLLDIVAGRMGGLGVSVRVSVRDLSPLNNKVEEHDTSDVAEGDADGDRMLLCVPTDGV